MGSTLLFTHIPIVYGQVYFNPDLLSIGTNNPNLSSMDLSRFEQGEQAPGKYHVDTYLNGQFIGTKNINFVSLPNGQLVPQFTKSQYGDMGVKVDTYPTLIKLAGSEVITDIGHYIPAASTDFKFSEQRLDISIPQVALSQLAQGYVDPKSWNEGVPAGLLNYSISGSHTKGMGNNQSQGSQDSVFTNLQSGINLGAWRLRNYSTYNFTADDSGSQSHFHSIDTYLQRDIQVLKGQLTMGDSSTPGDIFDSVQFSGVQLASDTNMLPDGLQGYAPIVRGVANSNAQVTIKQNGAVIYQTYVAPGAFVINDLYPSSYSGDLQVTIKEADGSERSFVQAFSSVAIMQRQGQYKYNMTAGKLRNMGDGGRDAKFMQGTIAYGLAHDITPYGGVILSQYYQAEILGIGASIGEFGAVSFDITQANAQLVNNSRSQGQSLQARYSKDMLTSGTTVTLAAYRYSTKGYYSFYDSQSADTVSDDELYNYRKRSEFQIQLQQNLGNWGSIYLSGDQRDFWGRDGNQRTFNAGINSSFKGVSYGISYSETHDSQDSQPTNKQVALNISLPLSQWLTPLAQNNYSANYGMTFDNTGYTNANLGLSGSALEDSKLSYSLNQSVGNRGQGYGAGAGVTYRGSSGVVNAGYNYSNTQQQWTYGLQGGVVVHPEGVTLSQPLSDTIAIVAAPKAADVKVTNTTGVYTDRRGYAVISAAPYRRTNIMLDPSNLSNHVAMNMTTAGVVPTQGAVVMAHYQTDIGQQVLMNLTHQGQAVPFGAMASIVGKDADNGSIVGNNGQVYLSGMPEQGQIKVMWGPLANQQCQVNFQLTQTQLASDTPVTLNGDCQ